MLRIKWPASLCSSVLAVALLILCGGCGGGSSTNNSLSAAQAQAVSQQVVQALTQAVQSVVTQNSPATAKAPRPRLSALAELQPDQLSGCTSTATGENCDFPVSYEGPCPGGGTIAVSGNVDGTLDNSGGGSLSGQITVTPANCSVSNLIINGDPSISVTGQIGFTNSAPVFPITLTQGGGISYGPKPSGSCQFNVTYSINSVSSCTVTGTLCGQSVNGSC